MRSLGSILQCQQLLSGSEVFRLAISIYNRLCSWHTTRSRRRPGRQRPLRFCSVLLQFPFESCTALVVLLVLAPIMLCCPSFYLFLDLGAPECLSKRPSIRTSRSLPYFGREANMYYNTIRITRFFPRIAIGWDGPADAGGGGFSDSELEFKNVVHGST